MRKLVIIMLTLLISLSLVGQKTHAAAQTDRLDGSDRFEVAVNISKKGFTKADTIVIANSNAYADALAASPLAYQHNAPILLSREDHLTNATRNRIKELRPKRVIVVGGTGSINDSVLKEVRNLGVSQVDRIAGKDRYEVASNIATYIKPNSKAIIAYGLTFADSLSIAPYAARNGIPILLTDKTQLPQKTKSILSSRKVSESIVVGGEGSISKGVMNQLPGAWRIGGSDRYEVAANIAKKMPYTSQKPYIATGLTFADALTGSIIAAKDNAPMLLTRTDRVPDPINTIIRNKGYKSFFILGGLGSVQQKVASKLSGPLAGLKIVVDAGHGGSDPGAGGNGIKEKDIVLDITKRVSSKIDNAGGYPVLSRATDTYVTLENRVTKAKSEGADTFVSIHTNSFSSSAPNGTETYWNAQYSGPESKELAQDIQKQLIAKLGTNDRGVKEAGFYVIKNTPMPSVLVEVAFISNSADAAKLKDPNFREKVSQAIFDGIVNFYNRR